MTERIMRRAMPDDQPTVMSLLTQRIAWLREQGRDQWTTRDFHPVMTEAIHRGETWILWEEGQPAATVSLTTRSDPDFWTDSEQAEPAMYISKLATAMSASGRGLGLEIMSWANAYAHLHGVPRLRWDVWRTNAALQEYYARIGFHPRRNVNVQGRWSGVLYELAYATLPATDLQTDTVVGVVAELASDVRFPLSQGDNLPDIEGDQAPDHWHVLQDIYVPLLGDPTATEPEPLVVPSLDTYKALLFNSGDGWRLQSVFNHRVASWRDQPDLSDSLPYVIKHERDTGSPGCRVCIVGDLIEAVHVDLTRKSAAG